MTLWTIGEPGGPAGPFSSIVSSTGRVIALQIPDRTVAAQIVAQHNAPWQELEALLDSALEHAAHAWAKLEQSGQTPPNDVWPPDTADTVLDSAPYYVAAMIGYVKRAYDLTDRQAHPEEYSLVNGDA